MSEMTFKYGASFIGRAADQDADVRPRYMAPMPSQEQKPRPSLDAANETVSQELRRLWLELRDAATHIDEVKAIVTFCERVGLLTDVQRELWARRVETCPGHADEGGRTWCAYCGNTTPPDGSVQEC